MSLLVAVAAAAPAPKAVLAVMGRVADWQLANPSKHKPIDWTCAAGYAGFMALAEISASPRFHNAMIRMGQGNEWKPGARPYHADDHAVGQTYVALYHRHEDPKKFDENATEIYGVGAFLLAGSEIYRMAGAK